ncbi:MAG: acylphosphatase [Lentimonas sp.]|jgi:acylphosphatase
MTSNIFRMNCWFEGHVQGVGFRYQTMCVAKGFEVAGTVQNLTDGRVHLCAEGEESEVQAFQEAVSEELNSYIRQAEIKTDSGLRTCESFRILQ